MSAFLTSVFADKWDHTVRWWGGVRLEDGNPAAVYWVTGKGDNEKKTPVTWETLTVVFTLKDETVF